MIITWHGEGAIKISDKEVNVAINPHDGSSTKMPKFAADICLVGGDFATQEPIRENPFIISNPGEYEVKGVFVYGIAAKNGEGPVTAFVVETEGVSVGYLGGIKQDQLSTPQLEYLEGVDVLLVPVGGDTTLDARQAIKCINQIEPRVIVPFYYQAKGMKNKQVGVEAFLKEYGVEKKHEVIDKLKISKKDLPQDDAKVIVLELS